MRLGRKKFIILTGPRMGHHILFRVTGKASGLGEAENKSEGGAEAMALIGISMGNAGQDEQFRTGYLE